MTRLRPDDSEPEPAPAARRTSRVARFRDLPPWTQAWTAVLGLLIAALGLGLTAFQIFLEPTPAPTAIVIRPEAYIDEVSIAAGEVSAHGGFRHVDIGSEVVLFIGRPRGVADARWLPVETSVTPEPSASGERVDGVWEVMRPLTEGGGFSWRAIVVPAGSGAADGYEDIRINGASSELVLASSEEFVTGE